MLCACGCGRETAVAKKSDHRTGAVRGQPTRYRRGHNMVGLVGETHPTWRGGCVSTDVNGYVRQYVPNHARRTRTVPVHILVVERALGHPLPPRARMHHVDHDRANNVGSNLVACEDTAYHNLLHQRERALDACGHADWRKCIHCQQYDAPENLYIRSYKGGSKVYHRACEAASAVRRYRRV